MWLMWEAGTKRKEIGKREGRGRPSKCHSRVTSPRSRKKERREGGGAGLREGADWG